jgi:mannitol/fructose-specific phosphotransferase system IIA component (Ntr-type)
VKIQHLIEAEHVYLDLRARELVQALEAMAELAAPGIGLEPKTVVDALLERERLGSTSVGDGFAIPHCKIGNLKEIAIFLARFATPVEFGASDDRAVTFFFVVLSPPDQPASHLQVLSQIARVLKRAEIRNDLLEAPDVEAVLRVMREAAESEGL